MFIMFCFIFFAVSYFTKMLSGWLPNFFQPFFVCFSFHFFFFGNFPIVSFHSGFKRIADIISALCLPVVSFHLGLFSVLDCFCF